MSEATACMLFARAGDGNPMQRTSPNTRLAHTRLDRPPEDRVEVDLYRANRQQVLQTCGILIWESIEWGTATEHTHFTNEHINGRASPSLHVGRHTRPEGVPYVGYADSTSSRRTCSCHSNAKSPLSGKLRDKSDLLP